MRGITTQRLRYAVAASLLAHLLIFWPGGLRVLTKDTPALLQATLRMLPQAPAEPAAQTPSPRAVAPAPTLAPPLPKPEPDLLERQAPVSVPQTLAAPAAPVSKSSPALDPLVSIAAAKAVPAPAAGLTAGVLLTEANASGEAVDGLRGYRLALAIEARRFKRYPAQATASGWEGSVAIRVEVDSEGRPRAATLVRSCGHELLDRAALDMIDAGAARARLPGSLRGKAFAVILPVVFNLED